MAVAYLSQRCWRASLVLSLALLAPLTCWAEQASNDIVTATTYWSATSVRPGEQINLAVVLDINPRYHILANTVDEPFEPTQVSISNIPIDVRATTALFPRAEPFEVTGQKSEVFSGRTVIYLSLFPTESARPREEPLDIVVAYQACDDRICFRATNINVGALLKIAAPSILVSPANTEIFAGMADLRETLRIGFFGWDFEFATSKLWLLFLVAGAGGLLLNFTPCVLPLIPIKMISLSRAAGDRRRCFRLGLIMSMGVVAFWLALAIAISSISGFNATNKLFQFPAFTISVGVIICVMAVGMCGLFSVRLPHWAYLANPSQESMFGSFVFGIMTAVLSTPCTAPFMGAAAAWSATQTPVITLSTFAAIGMGMALPYFLLSAFPALVNRVPRAGPASEVIKQVMGLLMLAAGAYFLGAGIAALLAKPPDPPSQAHWWLVALFIAAAGVWLAWRSWRIAKRVTQQFLFGAVGLAMVFAGVRIGARFTQLSPIDWIYYTPERLAEALLHHKVVVLEFTAAWCLNCLALEQGVLHSEKVVKLLNSTNVAPIKVDITGNNPAGNQKLLEVGRRTIPYLVVYSTNGDKVFTSDAYTADQLVQAIERAHR